MTGGEGGDRGRRRGQRTGTPARPRACFLQPCTQHANAPCVLFARAFSVLEKFWEGRSTHSRRVPFYHESTYKGTFEALRRVIGAYVFMIEQVLVVSYFSCHLSSVAST